MLENIQINLQMINENGKEIKGSMKLSQYNELKNKGVDMFEQFLDISLDKLNE